VHGYILPCARESNVGPAAILVLYHHFIFVFPIF
jgi:hypothetical protein